MHIKMPEAGWIVQISRDLTSCDVFVNSKIYHWLTDLLSRLQRQSNLNAKQAHIVNIPRQRQSTAPMTGAPGAPSLLPAIPLS